MFHNPLRWDYDPLKDLILDALRNTVCGGKGISPGRLCRQINMVYVAYRTQAEQQGTTYTQYDVDRRLKNMLLNEQISLKQKGEYVFFYLSKEQHETLCESRCRRMNAVFYESCSTTSSIIRE
jgi:hypothetical protein